MPMPLETIRAALMKTDGNMARAARALKMTRAAVAHRVRKSSMLQAVINDYRQALVDNAESGLGEAIKNGEPYAICFTLKTLGRDRGYIEHIEHSGVNGGPVEFTFVIQRTAPENGHGELMEPTRLAITAGGNGGGNGDG